MAHTPVPSAVDNTGANFQRIQYANPILSLAIAVSSSLSIRRKTFQGPLSFIHPGTTASHSFIHSRDHRHSFIHPFIVQIIERAPGTIPALQVTQAAMLWDTHGLSAPDRGSPGFRWPAGAQTLGTDSAPAWLAAALRTRRPAVPEPLLQNPRAFRLCG